MKKKVLTLNIKFIIQMVVITIYLLGCSGVNAVAIPEATPTDISTMIPTATNTSAPATETPTPVPIKLGIEALNPEELERYNSLPVRIDEVFINPNAWIDEYLNNKGNFLFDSRLPDAPDEIWLSEEQLKAAKVGEEIIYFMCRYGLMPDTTGHEIKRDFSFFGSLFGSNNFIPALESGCPLTPEIMAEITKSGWIVRVTYVEELEDISPEIGRVYLLNPENALRFGSNTSSLRSYEDDSLLLTNSVAYLFGVGPDRKSISEFAELVAPRGVESDVYYPRLVILKDGQGFDPFMEGRFLRYVTFFPPGDAILSLVKNNALTNRDLMDLIGNIIFTTSSELDK